MGHRPSRQFCCGLEGSEPFLTARLLFLLCSYIPKACLGHPKQLGLLESTDALKGGC